MSWRKNCIDDSSSEVINEMDRDVVDETKKFGSSRYFGNEKYTGKVIDDTVNDNSHLCDDGHSHDSIARRQDALPNMAEKQIRINQANINRGTQPPRSVPVIPLNSSQAENNTESGKSNPIAGVILFLVALILSITGINVIACILYIVSFVILHPQKEDEKQLRRDVIIAIALTAIIAFARGIIIEIAK